jgi:hypothetical protein
VAVVIVDSLLADGTLPTVLRARLLRLRGGIGVLGGEQALGEECYRESLELFRELGDERNEVALLGRFAVHAGEGGEPEEARRLVAEVRKLNETVANPVVEPQMLSTLAQVAAREGDEQEALRLTRESVAAARACEFRIWELWQLDRQAVRELELGLLDDAERTGREGLELARRLDDHRLMRTLLASLALVALRRADPKRAGTLWGAVDAAETDEPLVSLHEQFREVVAPLHDCADPRFLAAVDKGRALPTSQAVAVALDEGQTVP